LSIMAALAAFAEASAAERVPGPAKPWRRRDPAIHVFFGAAKTSMPATSAGMTTMGDEILVVPREAACQIFCR
jgi:hypothetical protein